MEPDPHPEALISVSRRQINGQVLVTLFPLLSTEMDVDLLSVFCIKLPLLVVIISAYECHVLSADRNDDGNHKFEIRQTRVCV